MRRTLRRTLLAAVAVLGAIGIAVVGAADPASAHSQLLGTEPARGATATQPLRSLRMTFNEPILARFSRILVTGPGGATYSTGHLTRVDNVVTQALLPTRTGNYTVAWRIVSADGHPVSGSYPFRVDLHGAAEPPVPPTQAAPGPPVAQDTGAHWQLPAVLGVMAVFAVASAVVRRRRTAPHTRP
ncbi:MAG: copper resistance protein [Cryptosporangiaceae bacterium]|jgi:methionine-rich copper-binding protein CopC|nr:copper resistance protein [Cryptosporangiaceae bacterium]MDQ1658697.1 copper resistance protein [Cryptosporangiaceae bacterium]